MAYSNICGCHVIHIKQLKTKHINNSYHYSDHKSYYVLMKTLVLITVSLAVLIPFSNESF